MRQDTRLPFMAMPDAIKSLTLLEQADKDNLTRHVYNVTSFSLCASQFLERVHEAFPQVEVSFEPDLARQMIVDSWPSDIDDPAASRDWQWAADYCIDRAVNDYLIPKIQERYG